MLSIADSAGNSHGIEEVTTRIRPTAEQKRGVQRQKIRLDAGRRVGSGLIRPGLQARFGDLVGGLHQLITLEDVAPHDLLCGAAHRIIRPLGDHVDDDLVVLDGQGVDLDSIPE